MTRRTVFKTEYRLPLLELERLGGGDYALYALPRTLPGIGDEMPIRTFCYEEFEKLSVLLLRRKQKIKVQITIRPVLTVRR